MLFSAWSSLLNPRPVHPTVYWKSQFECPTGTSNSTYPKFNSSSLSPSPLLKLTPSHAFLISVNGITVPLLTNLGIIPDFLFLLPPYTIGLGLLSPANSNSQISSVLSPFSPLLLPYIITVPCHYSLPSLSNTFSPSLQPATQIILLISGYDHITPLLKILQWLLPHCFQEKI